MEVRSIDLTILPVTDCLFFFFRCNSGWCIKADKYRNGIPDCSDGSDERTCKFNNFI